MSNKRLKPVLTNKNASGAGLRFLSIKKANRNQVKSNIQPIRGNNFQSKIQ